jgi:hypothetical protein
MMVEKACVAVIYAISVSYFKRKSNPITGLGRP